jgi:ABC-2 type transport system permease protein
MFYIQKDDFRQSLVISRNEIIKSIRGKKFILSLAVIVLIFALITLMPYATGDGWNGQTASDVLSAYLSYASMVILLIVALLSSVALVSEFEERTALILFTRPLKRTTIFVGKIVACVLIETLMMGLYYVLVAIMLLVFTQEIPATFLISFGFCFLYIFAASGIAFVISAFFKRSSICTIISLLILLLVIPILTMMISGDTWYMLDTAGNTILNCIPEYVSSYNQVIYQTLDQLQLAVNYLYTSTNPSIIDVADFMQSMIDTNMWGFMKPIEDPKLIREALVLVGWGLVAYLIAWIKFIKKEF